MPNPDWFWQIPVRDSIRLRLLVPDDSASFFEILQKDPEIQQHYVTWTVGLDSEGAVRKSIEGFQKNRSFRYAIVDGDRLVGYVGMWRMIMGSDREYDMGFFLDPSERGKGIVPAATQALIKAATKELPIETFAMYIWDKNLPSQSVARKLGFKPTDTIEFDEKLGVDDRRWELKVEAKTVTKQ